MQDVYIAGTLYVEKDLTWFASDGLPLNFIVRDNVVALDPGKKPDTLKTGDVYMPGHPRIQGFATVDTEKFPPA